jgi:hypothetical protein
MLAFFSKLVVIGSRRFYYFSSRKAEGGGRRAENGVLKMEDGRRGMEAKYYSGISEQNNKRFINFEKGWIKLSV